MPVLILTSHISHGGVASESEKCFGYFKSLNHTTFLWCTDFLEKNDKINFQFGFVSSRVHKHNFFKKIKMNITEFFNFYNKLKDSNFDIVIAMHFFPIMLMSLFCLFSRKKINFVSVYHTDLLGYYLDSFFLKKVIIRFLISLSNIYSKKIVFVSNHSMLRAVDYFKIDNSLFIPNGVDSFIPTVKIFPRKYNNTKINLLVVSTLVQSKRIDSIIRVFSLIRESGFYNVKLHIAGFGNQEKHLKELVSYLGLEENVIFLGYIKTSPSFYQSFDLLLSASEKEGLPLNILEAVSFGVPTIAIDCFTGPRDIMLQPENNKDFSLINYIKSSVGYLCPLQQKRCNFGIEPDKSEYILLTAVLDFFQHDFLFDNTSVIQSFSLKNVRSKWANLLGYLNL